MPESPADPARGRLYVLLTVPGPQTPMLYFSGVSLAGGTPQQRLYSGHFDNEWLQAWCGDLLFEPGRDGNLRAALTYRGGAWDGNVVFHPLADGIVNAQYGDYDDWSHFGRSLCASVANPGGLVPNPVPCRQ